MLFICMSLYIADGPRRLYLPGDLLLIVDARLQVDSTVPRGARQVSGRRIGRVGASLAAGGRPWGRRRRGRATLRGHVRGYPGGPALARSLSWRET